MGKKIVETRLFYRAAESIVPILTWSIILLPVWLSPFHPAAASYFILAFLIYFLYKSIKTIYYAAVAFRIINQAEKIDWFGRVKRNKKWQDIKHFIIVTNYKETVEKMEKTIDKLKDQQYLLGNIYVVLAMEAREGPEAYKRSQILHKKFAHSFAGFFTTYHTLKKGEVIGKASNEAFAARFIETFTLENNISPNNVVVTICDADSLLPRQYLAYVTAEYLRDKDRYYHFYWAPVLLYNNFWRLPLPIRVQSMLSSIVRLSLLPQRDDLIQISTYSTNLWLLQQVDFWDVDVIPEDWHIWLQAFFMFGEKVRTLPIYLPVSADAVLCRGLFRTFRNRYEQERRWAWGASDIPYAITHFFQSSHINPIVKLRKILFIIEIHLFWPTSFFILTISAFIPPIVNPIFGRTVMGYLLPKLSSFILTLSTLLLVFILYFDHKMREKVKVKTQLRHLPMLFIQWYLLPIISFFFSSLPALEAHTRLLLGKKLEYKVTEKI